MTTEKKRQELIALLEELAVLLDLDGANPFKIGAYAKGARALRDFEGDIGAALADGSLLKVQGIGKGLAEKIGEFFATGAIAEVTELRAKFPASLRELTEIPGFGAKKARAAWEALGIDSIAKLEAACNSGELAALKGFGAKTAANILAGIARRDGHRGRFRQDIAEEAAAVLLQHLRATPGVVRAEIAGSLRRRLETVKDIDFIVEADDSAAAMQAFITHPRVAEVIGNGTTKSSVILIGGMQADLRVVSRAEFPFALHHFTGSREHNVAMRQRAKDMGLRMNEYGLVPDGSEISLPATTEAEVLAHLGLDFIPPEMREDMGEIDAAAAHALPRLIERADIVGVPHMHTHWSDGTPELHEYADWAAANGIQWMGITDHSQTAAYAGGLKPDRVAAQQADIDAANLACAKRGVRLLKGIESDILADGSLDYDEATLATFDFIVASVHSRFELDEEAQTARLVRAVSNPRTTILGHATGRLLLKRDGIRCDMKEVIRACAKHGTAIEINGDARRLDMDWRLVKFALAEGCWISLGPDAHVMAGLANLDRALAMGRKGWLGPDRCVNCLGTDAFLAFARKGR